MKNKVVETVEEKISSKVNEMGFEIEYVEFVKEGDNNILRIVLDKPNGSISIDDCELVSRAVEDDIDKLVKTEYVLEVSSPGLERQLKNIKLYKKYTGENINVKLFKKNEIGKEFECILESVKEENESINVKIENKTYEIKLSEISSAHTVFDFQDSLKEKNPVNLNKLNKF